MRYLATAAMAAALAVSGHAFADTAFKATLAGHAILPATTVVQPPADAPAYFKVSGRYNGAPGLRVEDLGKFPGTSFLSDKAAPRPTGHSLPMSGQPVQGFSGIKAMKDGSFWVLVDNGFGGKGNSADALLMLHQIKPDWADGRVAKVARQRVRAGAGVRRVGVTW